MVTLPKGGGDCSEQVSVRKSMFGSFDDSDVIVWLKRLALNPCVPHPASRDSAKKLWNRTLMLRTVLNLCSSECPQRKGKLQQFLRSGKFAAASRFSSSRFNNQNVKQLGNTNSHSVRDSLDSPKCSTMQAVWNSCSSGSLFMFEDRSQSKDCSIVTSLDDAASWGPSDQDVSPLADTDESINMSNPWSPGKVIVEDASMMDPGDLVHCSDSSVSRRKVRQAGRFQKAENNARLVIPIGSSFQAEIPEWNEPVNQRIYGEGQSGNSEMIIKDSCMVDSDHLVHSSYSSSSKKQKIQYAARFLKAGYQSRAAIPIGPGFQAEVPEWTGPPSQGSYHGDSETLKWLGTRIWPVEGQSTRTNILPIRKGRSNSCSCVSRGSATCIKRHVREENQRMRSYLGPAYFSWDFDKIGEVVTESWTAKHEKTFESLMKRNPFSNQTSFWDLCLKYFPSKTQKNILSYYYNVYIPKRMSQLTRLSYEEIDSDEDQVTGEDLAE